MIRITAAIIALSATSVSAMTFDGRGAVGCAEGTRSQSIMQITEQGIAYQEYSCAFTSDDLNSDPLLDTRTLYCEDSLGDEPGWEDTVTLDLRHLPAAISFYNEGYDPDLIEACR